MVKPVCLVGLLVVSILFSCSNHSKRLSNSDFGDDWPFKVESGYVECVDGIMVVFKANGDSYALNDAARLSGNYKNVKEIIRPDANYPGKKIMMNLSLVEFEGIKLCDR